MSFAERYGRWAVVAGASEGLGAAFARALAARGLDLVLVARRAEPLEQLAEVLRARVKIRTIALDLGGDGAAAEVAARTADLDVGLLVCNAALAQAGRFFDLPLDEHLRAVDVNCRAPLALARLLGERMRARKRGGILFMSSLAAVYGGPFVATYAATKAFDCLLAESLSAELQPDGVDVLACVAGPTRTPGYERTMGGDLAPMDPDAVAEEALAALGRAPRLIPGVFNRATHLLLAQLPRAWVLRLVAGRMRKFAKEQP